MKVTKRILALVLVLSIVFLFGCSAKTPATSTGNDKPAEPSTPDKPATPEKLKKVDLRFGTSSSGGTWYTLGMGMATIWNEKLKDQGIQVFAQSTGGGQENAQMLANGEIDMGFLGSLLCYYTYNGLNNFEKNDKMRTLTSLQVGSVQWCIMEKDVKTGDYTDVKGLRFSLNNPGASGALHYEIVSQAVGGLDIVPEYLNPAAAAEAMKNGNLPGGSFDGGAPTGALLDLFSTANIKVRLLKFDKEVVDKMNTITPGVWTFGSITKDTYGMDEDVSVPQTKDSLVVTTAADEEAVYQLLVSMYDNLDEFKAVHSGNKVLSLDNALTGLSVPLHLGAIRFYKERGLEIPDYLIPPEAK